MTTFNRSRLCNLLLLAALFYACAQRSEPSDNSAKEGPKKALQAKIVYYAIPG
ncbi:MAG: hypothetical protein ACE5HO_13680 [bacterium]